MRIATLICAAAIGLAGCQSGGGSAPSADRTQAAAEPARVVSGTYTSRGRTFQLPPGEWRVVLERTRTANVAHAAPQTFTVLASHDDKVIDRVAVLWVQFKNQYKDRWSRYQGCDTPAKANVYFAEVKELVGDPNRYTSTTKVDCWHVRTVSLGLNGRPHFTTEALWDYAKANDLYLPVTMIGARFAQKPLYDRRDYAEFMWNADLIVPNAEGKPWLPADFAREAAKADPARKVAMDRLVAWGQAWRKRYPIASPAGPSS